MTDTAEITLAVEPWTTANTHFNLLFDDNDNPYIEYAGKQYSLSDANTLCKLSFNGHYDNNSGNQTANLKFILTDTTRTFRKKDNGIKNHGSEDGFIFNATLVEDDRVIIVTLAQVNIESTNFNFNFDIKSSSGGKDHVFDPEISIGRPPHPH